MTRRPGSGIVRRRPLLAYGMLLLVAALALLIVVDLFAFHALALRRLGYGADRYFQHSSLLGLEHVPNASGTWYAYKDGTRTQVSINAYGFPDVERSVEKTRPRIALLGDSTAEFWEVEQRDRAQHVMEAALEQRVEVLNFALRGAGTDQALIRFTEQVVHFSPDVVVLLLCINDLHNNATTAGKPYFVLDEEAPDGIRLAGMPIRREPVEDETWPRSWLQHSFTLRQLKYFLLGIPTHLRVDGPLDHHLELRTLKRSYDAEDERRMELLQRLIATIASEARSRHMRFLLVEGIYRPALDAAMRREIVEAYGDQFDFDKLTRTLESFSARTGIEFLSLPGLVRERSIDVNTLMHPEDTTHLNAEGVRLFSSAVISRLEQLGWLVPAAATSEDTRP
jgi:lysophospholipase L1-like esterase